MQLHIRRASARDIPEIGKLLAQVNAVHHYGRPDLFKLARKYNDAELLDIILDDAHPVFVACGEDGWTQGYDFCIHLRHENDNILTDNQNPVHLRGRGPARPALYEHVFEYVRASGCYNVTLNVWTAEPHSAQVL